MASRPFKSNQAVSKEDWEEEPIDTIAILRLPFQIVEHQQFQKSSSITYLSEFSSVRTVDRRLQSTVKEHQQNILRRLPLGAKLSIALDCWTSHSDNHLWRLLVTLSMTTGTIYMVYVY